MKRTFLPLAICILLLGCKGPQSDRQAPDSTLLSKGAQAALKTDDTLKAMISENTHKQPVVDSIFLGYKFSMTKTQSLEYFNRLIKDKKLVLNKNNRLYQYPMTFDPQQAVASLAPEFNNDKLYKLSLVIEPADDIANGEILYYQAARVYMQKYSDYPSFQEPDLVDPKKKHFHWFKNNLHIELSETVGGCIVSYTNLLVQETVDKTTSAAADSAQAQTKKDI